ncbi:hypothetical protein CAEBREN_19397 [Caenorhabditis brenneri]|uniref:Tyrosine-protein phosphatase domain-containing protein n=1 Tax=Caenorhabditis brenneri TaxID=135651 RepID=G0MZV7_CAEBE|nr:hypothetical protein CAEBREN_19397 [Caenorhabditis brenneri]
MHRKRKSKLSKLKINDVQRIDQVCGNQTRTLMKIISDGVYPEDPHSRGLDQSVVVSNLDGFRLQAFNSCRDAIGNFIPEEGLEVEKSRLARDASAAKTQPALDRDSFLKHTTLVSHLVNAIYLQTGLIEGKIPVDDLAGELLGFGSVKASDIANFKPDKVIALLNNLKEVGKTLNEGFNDEVRKMEEDTLSWNNMSKDHESIGDDPKIPERDQYFNDIASLKTIMPDLKSVGGVLKSYIDELDSLEGNAATWVLNGSLKSKLDTFSTFADTLDKASKNFKAAAEKTKSYESLKNGATLFKSLQTKILLMTTRGDKTPGSKSQNIDVVKKNIDAVVGAVDLSTSVATDMKNMDGMMQQKMNYGPKTKKYTDGFPNGVSGLKQLSKDVADPWISDIVGVAGSKLSKLTDGLFPLVKLTEQLSTTDEKIKPISSSKVHHSLIGFSQLQNEMSQLALDSMDSVEVYNGYEDCRQAVAPDDDVKTSKDFLSNVNLLAQAFPTVATAAQELNFEELVKEVNKFIESLGPQDDLNAVAGKLNNNADLKALKEKLVQVKKQFNFEGLETIVKVLEAKEGTDAKPFLNAWKRQNDVQKCLQGRQDHFNKAEKLSQSIQVIQMVRGFDANQYGDIELAASTITQIAQLFPTIRSIHEDMKKEVKDVTTEINKLPDSDKKSKAIGQSVSSLQYAFSLKDLENSLAQLKSVGPVVEAEVSKIKSASIKKAVEDQWGDHGKHISDLEATLTKIKAFEGKIDVSKASTIGEYGSPLKEMVMVPTANVNVQDKLKALDTLIPTADPKNKDALEEAKKTLEKIAPLDLNFSNYHGQFQSAPAAFQNFHDFLENFLSTSPEKKQNDGSLTDSLKADSKPESAGTSVWTIVCICGGVVIVVILLLGSIAFCIYKKKQKEREKREEEEKVQEAARRAREEEQRVRDVEQQRVRDEEQQRRLQQLENQNNQANRDRENAVQARERAEREANDALLAANNAANAERAAQRERDEAVERRNNAERRVQAMNAKNQKASNALANLQNKEREEAEARQKKLEEEITKWIIAQKFASEDQAIEVTTNNMRTTFIYSKVDFNASIDFLTAAKHRYPTDVPCKVDTAVHFRTKNDNQEIRIHANYVNSRSQPKKFIATQAPEPITFEEFWLMVLEHKTEYIVNLCQPAEKKAGRYDEYFNPEAGKGKECGNITVTTTGTSVVLDGLAKKWNFEVVDKKYGYKKQKVTLFQHLEWKDKSVPKRLEKTCELMDLVNKSKRPVIVHCSAGIGRTVTFIGLDIIMEEVENYPKLIPIQAITVLRDFRAMGVQNGTQLVWLQIAVGYRLSKKYKVDMKHYREQFLFFLKIRKSLFDMDAEVAQQNRDDREAAAREAEAKNQNAENNRVNAGTENVVDVPAENSNDEQAEDTDQPLDEDEIDEKMTEIKFRFSSFNPDADFKCLAEVVKNYEEIKRKASTAPERNQFAVEDVENQEDNESDSETARSKTLEELQEEFYALAAIAFAEQGDEPGGAQAQPVVDDGDGVN